MSWGNNFSYIEAQNFSYNDLASEQACYVVQSNGIYWLLEQYLHTVSHRSRKKDNEKIDVMHIHVYSEVYS